MATPDVESGVTTRAWGGRGASAALAVRTGRDGVRPAVGSREIPNPYP